MALPSLEAHLMCLALVAVDLAARTARMRLLLSACGARIPVRRVLGAALVGDAAAALTPFRAGGDVARGVALRRAGVSASRALIALAAEAVQTWAVILGGGVLLLGFCGGAAWASLAGGLSQTAHRIPPAAVAVIVLASGALGAVLLRVLRTLRPHVRASRTVPGLPVRRLAATVPLTVASIGARVLILPVLASSAAGPLAFGAMAAASFTLLHGQMILPAPAGAGAVDLGLLAGLGDAAGAGLLLVSWRLYTAGIGVAVGSALAAAALGGRVFTRRRTSSAPARPRNAPPCGTAFADPLPEPPPRGSGCC